MSFQKYDFSNLFVLDLANNHQGSVGHGKSIIEYCASLSKQYNLRAGIKFQFRDLPNFISPKEQIEPENKHVPRFLGTKLSWDEFAELKKDAKEKGLLTICTPFDEASVDKICEMDFDIIKVASCSANDWPLIEKIASANKPVICSTGGLTVEQIDKVVSYLTHNAVDFALMHCVSIYPTPDENCNLSDIQFMKERYQDITIGWSTHEDPDDILHVAMAKSLGAEMFERHVGLATSDITLNAYSSGPEQVEKWFSAYKRTLEILGQAGRHNIVDIEKSALAGLQRGTFVKTGVEAGTPLTENDVFFAFPLEEGQLASGDFKANMMLNSTLSSNDMVKVSDVDQKLSDVEQAEQVLKHAIYDVKALLAKANVTLNHMFKTEYSHHNGISDFRNVGTVLIEVINRDYAKKVLVQLPNQHHPLHMHKLKEETFLVIHGDLELELDGKVHTLGAGDTLTVLPGIWHQFSSKNGCVFEEISTTAYPNDSYYKDARISTLTSAQRKTCVDHWGRFQIKEQLV